MGQHTKHRSYSVMKKADKYSLLCTSEEIQLPEENEWNFSPQLQCLYGVGIEVNTAFIRQVLSRLRTKSNVVPGQSKCLFFCSGPGKFLFSYGTVCSALKLMSPSSSPSSLTFSSLSPIPFQKSIT